MQAQLPGLLVTDGCIYISSNLAAPGVTSVTARSSA